MKRTNLKNNTLNTLTLLIVLFAAISLNAQKRFYFDESGNKAKSSDAVYYKDITKSGDKYKVKEYYSSNDKLKLQGSYTTSSIRDEDRHGRFTTFYENGQLEYEVRFKYGKEEGDYISYHANGKEKEKGIFAGGKETEIGFTTTRMVRFQAKANTSLVCTMVIGYGIMKMARKRKRHVIKMGLKMAIISPIIQTVK